MTGQREMSLDEWCERLPATHRVRGQLRALREENERLRRSLESSVAAEAEAAKECVQAKWSYARVRWEHAPRPCPAFEEHPDLAKWLSEATEAGA